MKSNKELEALAEPLKALTIDEKGLLVQMIGLLPAYCPGCNCTLGSPYCHPLPESITFENDPQMQEECPTPR